MGWHCLSKVVSQTSLYVVTHSWVSFSWYWVSQITVVSTLHCTDDGDTCLEGWTPPYWGAATAREITAREDTVDNNIVVCGEDLNDPWFRAQGLYVNYAGFPLRMVLCDKETWWRGWWWRQGFLNIIWKSGVTQREMHWCWGMCCGQCSRIWFLGFLTLAGTDQIWNTGRCH